MEIIEKIKFAFQYTFEMILDFLFKILFSLDIFWKGMLAIFIALGVIMVVTMLLNLVINKIEKAKKTKDLIAQLEESEAAMKKL